MTEGSNEEGSTDDTAMRRVVGDLLGYKKEPGAEVREIVAVTKNAESRSEPAAKSMVAVVKVNGQRIAHYVPWINYYDLDQASRAEPGEWVIVEPATPYDEMAIWDPYRERFPDIP